MTNLSKMIIDMRPGEILALSGEVTVELVQKTGQLARLRVTVPPEATIEKTLLKKDRFVASMAD